MRIAYCTSFTSTYRFVGRYSCRLTIFCFDAIFEQTKVVRIDLLQIDVEGYDYEILKLFPFDKFLPTIIIFESENLSESDRIECNNWLKAKGYKLRQFGGDTLATLK